ncbi:HlyD family secretion protein [Phenylobacterium sp.]|uniref:HlyD family secretion protein n=1 Tax=Phenylobacterium sp. TaxID=1871053 RepID=UPI00272EEF88|nr:HlyD family secretion protein [Phenylobacterium sp.]MDP1989276.1 HlyD family secretion protein [Phenylobacterium sp.]
MALRDIVSRIKPVPLIGAAVLLAVGIGGVMWWLDRQHFETTDNAFAQADTVSVAPQIDGYVTEVLVADNVVVQKGQVLARIDAAPIEAGLAQAIARAQALEAAVRAVDDRAALEEAMIAQKAAGLQSARASAQLAEAERDRYQRLSQEGWVSAQRVQTVKAGASQADAAVAEAQATLEAERRTASSLGSARAQTQAEAEAARAAVDQARIDLSRTEIKAPVAGVVGARAVRPGQYVRPGGTLMSIVPVGQSYVVANFKETQVARLSIGQSVEVKADAFGGQTLTGRIESFAPATGSEFALIPVENAVGNFTKIAQRLPVRIAIDPGQPLAGALRPGLSVEVKVDVRETPGATFADAMSGAVVQADAR